MREALAAHREVCELIEEGEAAETEGGEGGAISASAGGEGCRRRSTAMNPGASFTHDTDKLVAFQVRNKTYMQWLGNVQCV